MKLAIINLQRDWRDIDIVNRSYRGTLLRRSYRSGEDVDVDFCTSAVYCFDMPF